jgi:hypothetical protein
VVLDEPFTGLDSSAAAAVAEELQRLRRNHGTALLLISHEPDVVALLMGSSRAAVEEGAGSHGSHNGSKAKGAELGSHGHSGSVLGPGGDSGIGHGSGLQRNSVITLHAALARNDHASGRQSKRALLAGTTLAQRLGTKTVDYCVWSLPLVLLALAACGLAMSYLTADLLRRIDVTEPVVKLVDQEVRPLLQLVSRGEPPNPLMLMMVKVRGTLARLGVGA